MSHRFIVPSSLPSSPAPSTPTRSARNGSDNPSTTPAGPAPSSVASYTPSGAPSEHCLGSSVMRGMAGAKVLSFGSQATAGGGRSSFGRSDGPGASLGRSIRGRERQPSALSRQYVVDEQDPALVEQDDYSEPELPPYPGGLFRKSSGRDQHPAQGDSVDDLEAELERLIENDVDAEATDSTHSSSESQSRQGSDEGDIFLNMRHDDRPYGQPIIGQAEEDMIMLNTPAATDRVRREAEDIFRRSSARLGGPSKSHGFRFATIARDFYTRQDPARIAESPDLILKTEALVCRLYQEGVGTEDDADKMDNSLANITCLLCQLWNDYVDCLPRPEEEDLATVGPGAQAEPFEKAAFVAQLMLRIHHTRFDHDGGDDRAPPPPEVLFDWLQTNHNLHPDQVREISRYKPSPACHGLFWQSLRCALLRGDVRGAYHLLRNAGWEHVRRGPSGDQAYTGKALETIRRFADETCDMLEQCPATRSDWTIRNSSWTLFRVQARGSLDKLTLFAEGNLDGAAARGPQSMSAMARKASSQIPWDVYENLQLVYGIVLGKPDSIMGTAQDWCEATVGLFGWWDDGSPPSANPPLSRSLGFGASASGMRPSDDYSERLAAAFHLVMRSDMTPNPINPVEVAIASVFEGNVDGVIGCLRTWSLPVAASVAEIASLGQWLPLPLGSKPPPTDALDMDDLDLLGVTPPSQDEIEGIKDTTLVLYARELAGIDRLSSQRDGWEVAIQVLGRMDLPEKADETVGELLRDLLVTLDETSSSTVDKTWRILNDLGMVNYAEETAEVSESSRGHGRLAAPC